MKKYYLRHKYLNNVNGQDYNYLNHNLETKEMFLDDYTNIVGYQIEFTDEDIEKLVQNYGFNLSEFDKVEVED